jgi:4-aminobutyrate aminotransferase-like enzyme
MAADQNVMRYGELICSFSPTGSEPVENANKVNRNIAKKYRYTAGPADPIPDLEQKYFKKHKLLFLSDLHGIYIYSGSNITKVYIF